MQKIQAGEGTSAALQQLQEQNVTNLYFQISSRFVTNVVLNNDQNMVPIRSKIGYDILSLCSRYGANTVEYG